VTKVIEEHSGLTSDDGNTQEPKADSQSDSVSDVIGGGQLDTSTSEGPEVEVASSDDDNL
jgi:hypothetical protein